MPEFYPDSMDISPSEFVSDCSSREIKKLIEILIEDGHLPSSVLNQTPNSKSYSRLQSEFEDKTNKLSKVYHSISKDDEEILEKIFKKYL